MAIMKLKELEQCIEDLDSFERPKVKLEQYSTQGHIAARMLHVIASSFGEIEGKVIADLGCGCGHLSIGAALLGAQFVVGFDIDEDALRVCQRNIEANELKNMDLMLCDIAYNFPKGFENKFDCVIMNPPFGTNVKGTDMEFLKVALSITKGSVYSLHKTSTRTHVLKKAKQLNLKCDVLAQLRFDLPASYKFHKKVSIDIEVDFVRFYK